MTTADKWDYDGWRRRMAFELSLWRWNGVKRMVHLEQITLTSTQPSSQYIGQDKPMSTAEKPQSC